MGGRSIKVLATGRVHLYFLEAGNHWRFAEDGSAILLDIKGRIQLSVQQVEATNGFRKILKVGTMITAYSDPTFLFFQIGGDEQVCGLHVETVDERLDFSQLMQSALKRLKERRG